MKIIRNSCSEYVLQSKVTLKHLSSREEIMSDWLIHGDQKLVEGYNTTSTDVDFFGLN